MLVLDKKKNGRDIDNKRRWIGRASFEGKSFDSFVRVV